MHAQEQLPPVPAATAVAEASRIQVRVVGQGPDVILIPGLGSSS